LEEKRRFSHRLVREGGLPKELVQLALFDVHRMGFTAGANRNALLLGTAGELMLCADDDTVCHLVEPPGGDERLVLTRGLPESGGFSRTAERRWRGPLQ
jgi:hypothetical protein